MYRAVEDMDVAGSVRERTVTSHRYSLGKWSGSEFAWGILPVDVSARNGSEKQPVTSLKFQILDMDRLSYRF